MRQDNFQKALKEAGKDKEFNKTSRQLSRLTEGIISRLFIDAVNKYDGERIIEIAKSVWFFKRFFGGNDDSFKCHDEERALLLMLKAGLEQNKEKMKIADVASFLANGKKVETPADGFKSLRLKCRAIGFPLDEKRRIRKK